MALILVCSESQNKLVKDKHFGCIQSCAKSTNLEILLSAMPCYVGYLIYCLAILNHVLTRYMLTQLDFLSIEEEEPP